MLENIFFILVGSLAGFIDSIAGGGGLITLPVLTHALSDYTLAIGTNKIPGSFAAGLAFLLYSRKTSFPKKEAYSFGAAVALGSFAGSSLNPYVPKSVFPWLLTISCPVILGLVWSRKLWITTTAKRSHLGLCILSGVACGLYDGMWGPGGGTFMLLALLVFVKLPLMQAILVSKFVNTLSATTAFTQYARLDKINYWVGLMVGSGMFVGVALGQRLAHKHAEKIVKPMLTFVVLLLLISIWMKN